MAAENVRVLNRHTILLAKYILGGENKKQRWLRARKVKRRKLVLAIVRPHTS